MPFTVKDIALGGLAPAGVAFVIAWLVRRWFGRGEGRYAAPLAILCGFLTGYALLALGPWQPSAHWHWLPYTAMGAAFVGAVAAVEGVSVFERLGLDAIVAVVAAWLLAADWDDLSPSRTTQIVSLAVCMVLWSQLFRPLPRKLPGPAGPALLWATVTAASIVLALSGSLRFAQIAIAISAAMFGVGVVAIRSPERDHLRGASLLSALAVVGPLYIGWVNSFSDVPFVAYAIVAAAPLLAWPAVGGPLAKLTSAKRALAIAVLPFVGLAIGVTIAAVVELGGGGGY